MQPMSEQQSDLDLTKQLSESSGSNDLPDLFLVYQKELVNAGPQAEKNLQSILSYIKEYSIQFQKDILNQLSNSETLGRLSQKTWGFSENLVLVKKFIMKKFSDLTQFNLADIKTYIEQEFDKKQKSSTSQNILPSANNTTSEQKITEFIWSNTIPKENAIISNEELLLQKKQLEEQNSKDLDTKNKNKEIAKLSKLEYNNSILKSITEKLAAKKAQILADKEYSGAKEIFQKQIGKTIDDEYFVTRFALDRIDTPNAYLTQQDLGGLSKEELIASLNEQYGIREVVSTKARGFTNESFDWLIAADVQSDIAAGKSWLDDVYSVAEAEYFQKNAPMREKLDNVVTRGLFPWAKARSGDKINAYRSETEDGKDWIPQDKLQTSSSFSRRLDEKNIPEPTKSQWLKYYNESYLTARNNPSSLKSPRERYMYRRFLNNIALVESISYRNTVQQSTSKLIAESIFHDVAMLTGENMENMKDWKLVKQKDTDTYTSMDDDGNVTIKYELHGIPGTLRVDSSGAVTMEPLIWQEAGYIDLITRKKQVWRITWVNTYIEQITTQLRSQWRRWRMMRPERLQWAIQDCMKQDKDAIDTTKASMHTTITRQQFFDALLSGSWNVTADRMKDDMKNFKKSGEKILVQWVDKNDYSQLLMSVYNYTLSASKTETSTMIKTYSQLQEYLRNHPDFTISKLIKKKPEYIGTILLKTPMSQWKDLPYHWEKQWNEEQSKAHIDTELDALEKKINESYK